MNLSHFIEKSWITEVLSAPLGWSVLWGPLRMEACLFSLGVARQVATAFLCCFLHLREQHALCQRGGLTPGLVQIQSPVSLFYLGANEYICNILRY